MKKERIYYIIVLLLSFSYVASAQSVSFTNYASKKPERNESMRLKRDAARLALRMDANNEDFRYLPIQIQESKINAISKVLSSIKNSSSAAARAISNCKIHALPNPSIDQFILIYQKDISWANPLREGINETESDDINDLLDEYDLFISNHVNWNNELDAITIQSHRPYNMAALAQEFGQIEGVNKIELSSKQSDGNDIQITFSGQQWLVTYFLKWGSCMNGCDKTHSWSFKVAADGKVQFIKESGDEIPAWMRCQTNPRNTYLAALKK